MADPFVIYTMGESGLFASALNGVAMLFNDTDLFHGTGLGNLGIGAFFGIMLLFVVWIYNAAFKQQMDLRALLAPLIVYMVLTVPKTTIAIEEISTGNVKTVANVPIGLGLPAAVASGFSIVFTEIVEKAYQVVGGSPSGYMPKISEEGYVTPLKLINALRDSASIVPSQSLLQTTKNIYQSCVATNPNFNIETYRKDENPVKYFTDVAKTSSNTVVWVTLAVTGVTSDSVMTCEAAGNELQKAMTAYVDGVNNSTGGPTQVNKIIGDVTLYNLKNALIRQMTANGEVAGFNPKPTAGGSNYNINDMVNYVSLIGNTSQDNARNFMMATIFNPMLETASYCYDKADGMSGMSKCSAWISSRSQWEEKNAAAGTGFLQVMRDGQNVLIMISFLFFPIMVLFVMIQGTSSFKLLGNYMAFTVSAYLWLPVAAMINFYIQHALADEWYKVATATGIHSLNLITGPQFYAAVSQKLSLANSLLASVPMLCMMLFTGMMMGMSQITARMNSADAGNYDAKVNTPDVSKSAPLATTNSTVSISGLGVATVNGAPDLSISSSHSHKSATELSKAASTKRSEIESAIANLQSSMGVEIGHSKTNSTATGSQHGYNATNTINTGSTTQAGTTKATQVTNTDGTSLDNSASKQEATSSAVSGGGGVSGGVTGNKNFGGDGGKNNAVGGKDSKNPATLNVQGGAQIGGQITGSKSTVNSNATALNTSKTTSLADSDTEFKSTAATNANSKSVASTSTDYSQRLQELRNTATQTKGSGFTQQYSNDFNKIQEKIESLKQIEQESMEFTSSFSANASQIKGMMTLNPQAFENFKSSINMDDPKFQERVRQHENSLISVGTNQDKQDIALVMAAKTSDNAAYSMAAMEFLSPQGAERYKEMSQSVGDISVKDIGNRVDQKTANAQAQIDHAQERTNLSPNANTLPSKVDGPHTNSVHAPQKVNPNLLPVDPQSYSDKAKEANSEVHDKTKHLLSTEPKK